MSDRIEVASSHRAVVTVRRTTITLEELRELLAPYPAEATFTAREITGGTQREPEQVGMRFTIDMSGVQA